MENDPKTLLMQLISNLELAEMRAEQLTDPETGFCLHSRIRYVPRIVDALLDEVKSIMNEAFPPESELDRSIRLLQDKIQEEVAVPKHFYDSPIQVE